MRSTLCIQASSRWEPQILFELWRVITATAIDIARLADGKFVEHWGVMDTLGVMQQPGLIPAPT